MNQARLQICFVFSSFLYFSLDFLFPTDDLIFRAGNEFGEEKKKKNRDLIKARK